MVTSNQTLLQKADLDLATLQSDGGFLQEQQADRFIRLAIKESVLLPMIKVTSMKGPVEERDKTRFTSRVLKPGTEATALGVAQRSKTDLSKYTLSAKLFRAEVRLSDEVLEDQIERSVFKDTVMDMLAGAVSRDVEFIAVQGDVLSSDALLAVLDGFLKQATSNVVDALGAPLSKDILVDMLKVLPDEYSRTEKLKLFTNRQARIDYRDTMSERMTPYGDMMLQSDKTTFQDIPLVAVPEFPNTGSATSVLLTDPKNLVIAFHRKIRFETQRDAPAGVTVICATVRFDVKIEEVAMVSKAINVSTA